MFSQFFGNYLVETKKITAEQYDSCMEYIKANRVQLGLIAETEGLLTRAQTNELNYMQMQTDKRFGDLAVEKGYLTEADVSYLLGRQGNPYLIFVQALIEGDIMTAEEIDACLKSYQEDNQFSDETITAIKEGNIEHLLLAFIDEESSDYKDIIGLTLRNIVRFVSSYIRVEKGEFVKEASFKAAAYQHTIGAYNGMLGFASNDDAGILKIADGYAKESFGAVDEDALDSVAEFTNCVNGLYAAELSFNEIKIDMQPPEYHIDTVIDCGGQPFYVMPLYIEGERVNIIVKVG